jgi:hypothetical protein
VRGPLRRHRLIMLAALLVMPGTPAWSASTSRKVDRDAAYLEQAFSHDLCTRDDRALRKLTKALSKKPNIVSR